MISFRVWNSFHSEELEWASEVSAPSSPQQVGKVVLNWILFQYPISFPKTFYYCTTWHVTILISFLFHFKWLFSDVMKRHSFISLISSLNYDVAWNIVNSSHYFYDHCFQGLSFLIVFAWSQTHLIQWSFSFFFNFL